MLKVKREELVDKLVESIKILDSANARAIATHLIDSPHIKPALLRQQEYEDICFSSGLRPTSPNDLEESYNGQEESRLVSNEIPFRAPDKQTLKFIDLFAGIGGFRLAFQSVGGHCVFSSEWDKHAKSTYEANFGDYPYGDITQIKGNDIPDHDVLCAGFPCQAFSVAGYRQGFEDKQGRGNLFFNIIDILKAKKPKAFLLENVKNLVGHDKGNTFARIKQELADLNYHIDWKVLNSRDHGNTPQTRERIFIVGFKKKVTLEEFAWPVEQALTKSIADIVKSEADDDYYYDRFSIYPTLKESVVKKETIYQWRRVYVRENKSNACPTLTANMGTGGHNVPIVRDNKGIRKLTPRECAGFQGYPDNYILPSTLAKSHLYKQIGNSVTVPVVRRVAEEIQKVL